MQYLKPAIGNTTQYEPFIVGNRAYSATFKSDYNRAPLKKYCHLYTIDLSCSSYLNAKSFEYYGALPDAEPTTVWTIDAFIDGGE